MKQSRQAVDTRRANILTLIRERKRIRVEELAALYGVSLMTIRRDLQALEDQGKIGRYYGGASVDPGLASEAEKDPIAVYRHMISRCAAGLTEPGDRLFINGSNTALDVLDYLDHTPVSVFTNNARATDRRFPSGVEVTLSGGDLRQPGHVMTGDCAMRNLLMARADKAFLGCTGISPDGDILCGIPTELGINETMIAHANRYFILADHTKIGKSGTYASFSLENAGTLITDAQADRHILDRLRDRGMQVIQVGRSEGENER